MDRFVLYKKLHHNTLETDELRSRTAPFLNHKVRYLDDFHTMFIGQGIVKLNEPFKIRFFISL